MRTVKLNDAVALLPAAAGATRLKLSADGRKLAVENSSDLARADRDPPEFRVADLAGDAPSDSRRGWVLADPNERGDVLYLTRDDDVYVVRSSAQPTVALTLTPPQGDWRLKGSFACPDVGRAIVVLWMPVDGSDSNDPLRREDRLWIASVGIESMAVEAHRTLDRTTAHVDGLPLDAGIAGGTDAIYLALLPAPESSAPASWSVESLDARTLDSRWRRSIGPRIDDPSARVLQSTVVAASRDANSVIVLHGRADRAGVSPTSAVILDAASGDVRRRIGADDLLLAGYPIRGVQQGGGSHVTWVSYFDQRDVAPRYTRLEGVVDYDLASGAGSIIYRLDRAALTRTGIRDVDGLMPSAFVADVRSGLIYLAPPGGDWLRNLGARETTIHR